jgi:2-keto-4-pentenoate hydratase/2-oxohepta-3-ene-1,7-dioic acid hydratase in catechol pathway
MSTDWSLVTCRLPGSGTDIAAVRRTDGSLVVPDQLRRYHGLIEVLGDWDELEGSLRGVDVSGLAPVTAATIAASVRYPRKVLCVGANYRDHIAEMGGEIDPGSWRPFFFVVPPTTTLIGDGETIVIPDDPAMMVDWEAELAVVIGRGGRDIPRAEAGAHIAGYACFSDITARGLLRRPAAVAEAFRWDWAGSKSLDTFCPIGAVTPAWMVPDPGHLSVRCLVNGMVKQDGSTSDFICDVFDVVAAASQTWTLEPGDVIATGTPAGVGFPRGERLANGDEVRVEISGLVPLVNPVAARVLARSQ